MSWQDNLKGRQSAIDLVQSILDQIPEANGGRMAFEACLYSIADGSSSGATHVLINEDGEAVGTTSDLDLVERLEEGSDGLYAYELASLKPMTEADFPDDDSDDEDEDDED